MRNTSKAPTNADPTPMAADEMRAFPLMVAASASSLMHSSAAIGVQLSAFIGASKAVRRTKC
jgi:hypothetical protein